MKLLKKMAILGTKFEKPGAKVVVDDAETDATETSESLEIRPSHDFDDDEEPGRRIRFAPEVDVFDIPSRDELTDDEYYLSFYSKEEIACMNQAQNETADRMESGKKAKKSSPYRGLEAWTKEGQQIMSQRILACIDAVLNEQDRQWACGRDSMRRIAKVYKSLSKTSKLIARELAKKDEKEACKVYEQSCEEDNPVQEDDDLWEEPLRMAIESSSIMKKKKKKMNRSSSGRSIGSTDTISLDSFSSLGASLHSTDSTDSAFWSLNSSSLFDIKPSGGEIPKKRKCKKKSAARLGEECPDSPGKTSGPRRKVVRNNATWVI